MENKIICDVCEGAGFSVITRIVPACCGSFHNGECCGFPQPSPEPEQICCEKCLGDGYLTEENQ